tara:strand:- start:74 stop:721 length:648 start_codon:yes stop_codon:yes gene_type:complete
MSDYDLSLTGAQIDSALNKVHNADTTPTNGSQNMITSDAVHDSISGFLTSSDLATDFTSPNNTTAPTTQAVQNLFDSADVTTITRTGQYTTTSRTNTTDLTGTSIVGSRITKDSNNVYTIESGYYMVFCSLESYGTISDRQGVFTFVGSGTFPHSPDNLLLSGYGTSYVAQGFQTNLWFDGSANTFNLYAYVSSPSNNNNVALFRNVKMAFIKIG